MRVGLVSPYSLASPGGVQNHLLSLAPALERVGIRAEILAPTDDDEPASDTPIISLGKSIPFRANGSVARIGLSPFGVRRLRESLGRYDVLHVHEPLVPGVAFAAARQTKVPTVGTFHAASDDGSYFAYEYFGRFLSSGWRNLDVRIAVSEAARMRVTRYFEGKVEIIPNGFDFDRFATAEPLSDAAETSGPIIVFVGRNEPRKGLSVLLRAFDRVLRDIPDAELWIGGPGTETIRRHRVRSFGGVDAATLSSLYASADVFCAPARFGESFGIVLLEAMAARAAIVATQIDGYAAVARDDVEAVLVPVDDDVALAAAIVRVLTDTDLMETLVTAGVRRAQEFDWSVLSGKIIAAYERAIGA